jgi:hypothetical protein
MKLVSGSASVAQERGASAKVARMAESHAEKTDKGIANC